MRIVSISSGKSATNDPLAVSALSLAPVTPWCNSTGKRIFDLVCATLLFIPALPLMVIASIVVKTSHGPVFFSSPRVGKGGRKIQVLKFRSMVHNASEGVQLTRRGDGRVTRAGRFLRKWKIDELPQLINVLRGEMSFVGPRPDSSEFLSKLPSDLQPVLMLKPGITGAATLRYRNEEELLGGVPEGSLLAFYVLELLPAKVRLDLEYARRATLYADVGILLKTARAIFR